jgi:hypothetical protein
MSTYILHLTMLQCAIPVFDGLLPEPHNNAVLDLLFVMAHWHGLAKLRMHHDLTLDIMESVTVNLGKLLRSFSDITCSAFATKELRREADARARREARKGVALASNSQADVAIEQHNYSRRRGPGGAVGRRLKTFNLNTYKSHSYGDYVKAIREYGTTDSYSSEPVCCIMNFSFFFHLIAL